MTEREDFADFKINTGGGRVGYLYNPEIVTDKDGNGAGKLPGPNGSGIGQNGKPVEQKPYAATNLGFFEDESKYVPGGFNRLTAETIAADPAYLDQVDSLVIADVIAPARRLRHGRLLHEPEGMGRARRQPRAHGPGPPPARRARRR